MPFRPKKLVFFAYVLTNNMYTTRQLQEQFTNVSSSRKATNTFFFLLLVLLGPHSWKACKDAQTRPMTTEEERRELFKTPEAAPSSSWDLSTPLFTQLDLPYRHLGGSVATHFPHPL